MKWFDVDHEMKWFAKERNVKYYQDGSRYREFNLYNVRSGNVFCRLNVYDDGSYEIETIDFFNDIKDELYKLTMNYFIDEEAYHYDKWILPLLRDNRIKELVI